MYIYCQCPTACPSGRSRTYSMCAGTTFLDKCVLYPKIVGTHRSRCILSAFRDDFPPVFWAVITVFSGGIWRESGLNAVCRKTPNKTFMQLLPFQITSSSLQVSACTEFDANVLLVVIYNCVMCDAPSAVSAVAICWVIRLFASHSLWCSASLCPVQHNLFQQQSTIGQINLTVFSFLSLLFWFQF